MSRRLFFRGARVVDPASQRDEVGDVLVGDGRIEGVGSGLDSKGATVVDCDGMVLAPGLVDLHAHLREPGREDKETVETGSRAAAVGGYTAVCAMPNTEPVTDNAGIVAEVRALAERAGICAVYPAGAITRGLEGEALTDIGEMAQAGVRLFTDDGRCVQSSRIMRLALEYSRPFDVVIGQHSQDEALSEGWQMHEGHYSALLGLSGAPAEAEEIIVARDIALARLTGGRLHITHVSSAGTVELIRQAARRQLPLTADVTPHHLALADEDLVTYDTNLKVNPPLRSVEHRDGLRDGLAEGLIDAVATDHAPHAVEEKEQEFDQAPPGTTGLETALAVVLTELVEPGILDLATALRRMSTGPAHILRLDDQGGPLEPGSAANLMVFDPAAEWTVEPGGFESKSRNSAFLGRTLRGRVVHTVFRGDLVVHEGKAQK
jgi:dihydroorotase